MEEKMKKMARNLALIIALTSALIFTVCGGDHDKKSGPADTVIASPGQAGYDAELEDFMNQHFRQFAFLNSIAIGVGYNDFTVEKDNDDDKDILTRYFNQYSGSLVWNREEIDNDFKAFCAQDAKCGGKYKALADNPRDGISGIIKRYGGFGDTGMFGGVAIAADLLRYAVLRDQGYPPEIVEEARQRAIHVLEVIDIGNSIGGVPGVLVRGLRRKDHGPSWESYNPQEMPEETPPPNTEKHNTWREDNTADKRFEDWGWEDNASKDQVDGWIFAMGVAWDVIAEDPEIPQEYRDMLVSHARNFAQSLMQVSPELGTDMLIRDADGKLTQWCDLNPNVINLQGGCWNASYSLEPFNTFSAIMGLGVMRSLYHITGNEDIRDYYYGELIGNRGWHEFARDGFLPIVDMGYATNYSNVNMVFIAFYNVLRYETDPEVRSVVQEALERLWDNGNDRQPKHINQTFFDVIYSGLRAGGNVPEEVEQGIETLKQWPPTPMWAKDVINCTDQELIDGECLAVDGETIIELPVKYNPDLYQYYDETADRGRVGLGHNSEIVAEHVLPRRLRGDSNFDWRSNPFAVNYFRNPYEINAVGDIMAAYWLGRHLKAGTGADRNVLPLGRAGM